MKQVQQPGRMTVRFWGVCGSIPVGMTNDRLEDKQVRLLERLERAKGLDLSKMSREDKLRWMRENVPFDIRGTHGGNTTCVEVRCDDTLLILDMGTGLRELGLELRNQVLRDKKLHGHIFQSHVHWDHIQGFPFWKPLYMPRRFFDCHFYFHGGKSWDAKLEEVLAGQMNPPLFPVNLAEIRHTAMHMEFDTVYDGWTTGIAGSAGPITVIARKLFHPQETFGYRISYAGKVLTFTTDHEPYASGLPRGLLELVQGADVWITDCQYSHNNYTGKEDNVQKHGWGHSFPEFIAAVAREAQPKHIYTTHHDPESSDSWIRHLADQVANESKILTASAYEGLIHQV